MGYEIRLVSGAEQIAERMPCARCGAEVDWAQQYRFRTDDFTCPHCGAVRAIEKSANRALRLRVFSRDRWTCHRCRLPVDPLFTPPFLFSGVADHYPVTRRRGGPTIEANLRCAHYLCNTTLYDDPWALLAKWGSVPAFRDILVRYLTLPRDETKHIHTPAPGT